MGLQRTGRPFFPQHRRPSSPPSRYAFACRFTVAKPTPTIFATFSRVSPWCSSHRISIFRRVGPWGCSCRSSPTIRCSSSDKRTRNHAILDLRSSANRSVVRRSLGEPAVIYQNPVPRTRTVHFNPRKVYLGQCEVTVGQFRKFVEESKHDAGMRWQDAFPSQTDDHPVVYVDLERRRRAVQVAQRQRGEDLPAADRGAVGIRLPRGHNHQVQLRGR